jgi:hypothetical protein
MRRWQFANVAEALSAEERKAKKFTFIASTVSSKFLRALATAEGACLALPCLAQPLPLRLCEQMQRLGLSTAFRAHRDRFGALVRCGCTLRRLVESGQMNRPRGVQHRPRVRRNSDGL